MQVNQKTVADSHPKECDFEILFAVLVVLSGKASNEDQEALADMATRIWNTSTSPHVTTKCVIGTRQLSTVGQGPVLVRARGLQTEETHCVCHTNTHTYTTIGPKIITLHHVIFQN